MNLDDVTSSESFSNIERQLVIIKTLRQIGLEIISFLASLEDFQKKLWLKKKFVVRSDYSITLDRVDEKLYPLIVENDDQWQKWEELGFRDKAAKNWQTEAYLQEHQYMMLDTELFPNSFKYQLINSIESLDEQLEGIIIHSDNFQALNLLQKRYRESVQAIYIDPPYNAPASEILYKNSYKHSSWLSLMNDRIIQSLGLFSEKAVFMIAIDEHENSKLELLLDQTFSGVNINTATIRHNPRGQQGKNFSYVHEFCHYIYPDTGEKFLEDIPRKEVDSRNLRDSGSESDRSDARNCFYPIIIDNNCNIVKIGDVPADDFHPQASNVLRDDGLIEIWPINENGDEKKWRYARQSIDKIIKFLSIKSGRTSNQVIYNKTTGVMRSIWDDPRYDASEYGTKILQNILGKEPANLFSYPKSIYTVMDSLKASNGAVILDFFAGSGTTAHATIELNREDNGQRKYILVEQGEYFDTVLKPRIQKVIYSQNWKDGKPLNPETGMSHCLKVMKLESYEDTLNNLELIRSKAQEKLFENDKLTPEQKDDYLMHYMLNFESRGSLLSVKDFYNPFDYKMKITIDSAGAYEEVPVDLIETFNYLIGLKVRDIDYQIERGYVQVTGTTRDGEYTTIIWRDCEKLSYNDLNALIEKLKINATDSEYDLIYVNGDHNIANRNVSVAGTEKTLKIRSIENDFMQLMFEEQ